MGYRELQPEDENLVTGLTDDGSVPGEEAPHSRPEVGVAAIRMQVEGWSAPELKKAQEEDSSLVWIVKTRRQTVTRPPWSEVSPKEEVIK